MHRTIGESQTQSLGEIVAAAYELGVTIASDRGVAAELAARHLERMLARGRNVRIAAALVDLASELEPARAHAAPSRSASSITHAA